MKVVLQRVKSASVTVDGELIASIGKGILALAAVGKDDTIKDSEKSAAKLLNMRLWDDEQGVRWKKSVKDIQGEVLCVSQFTLLASTKKGTKPDFHKSAGPDKGKELYSAFFTKVQELYVKERVKDGVFQAMMDVGTYTASMMTSLTTHCSALINDGPVGLIYICEHGDVTIEINTDPPPMDLPGEPKSMKLEGTMSVDELANAVQMMAYDFTLSPELME